MVEQLVALGVTPGDQKSAADTIVTLRNELADVKRAQEKAQTNVETLSQAVEELKKMTDQLSAHVPSLEA
jgi:predicted  nucleic acid-binding Zn-ribbon protein